MSLVYGELIGCGSTSLGCLDLTSRNEKLSYQIFENDIK